MRKCVITLALAIFCLSGCNAGTSHGADSNSVNSSSSIMESSFGELSSAAENSSDVSSGIAESSSDNSSSASESKASFSSDIEEEVSEPVLSSEPYSRDTRISDVINAPVFGDYGRLIFPVNEGYYSGNTLGELRLTWYNNIDPEKTVEIVNYMRSHAVAGDVIFYDIYSDAEKSADSRKKVRGMQRGRRVCVCGGNAGQLSARSGTF